LNSTGFPANGYAGGPDGKLMMTPRRALRHGHRRGQRRRHRRDAFWVCRLTGTGQGADAAMNPIERVARDFDGWQQRHPVVGFPIAVVKKFGDDQAGYLVSLLAYYAFVAAFPLLLALTAVVGVILRTHPKLQQHLLNSAFAEFPIVGHQIHEQLGVTSLGHASVPLTIGILGSLYGARGFANALQNTLNTLWAVPKVNWPGFPNRYLRMFATLLLLGLILVVTGASSAAAGTAASWGFGGLPARTISFVVGTVLGTGFFLALFRVAASGEVAMRAMVPGAAISAVGWQLLLTTAAVIVAHQLRHAQAVAGFFGVVLGLLAWLALQATVIVYAIEVDVVRVNRLWPRSIVQPPLIEGDKAYYSKALRTETRRPEQRLDIAYEPDEQVNDQDSDNRQPTRDRPDPPRTEEPGH
jgi:membrane protein